MKALRAKGLTRVLNSFRQETEKRKTEFAGADVACRNRLPQGAGSLWRVALSELSSQVPCQGGELPDPLHHTCQGIKGKEDSKSLRSKCLQAAIRRCRTGRWTTPIRLRRTASNPTFAETALRPEASKPAKAGLDASGGQRHS